MTISPRAGRAVSGGLSAVLLATLCACAESAPDRALSGQSAAGETTATEHGAVREDDGNVVSWMTTEFTGRGDSDGFHLEMGETRAFTTRTTFGSFATVRRPVYCEALVTLSGGIVLNTVSGSIGSTPARCDLPDVFPYSAGVYCARVRMRSNFDVDLQDVGVAITQHMPAEVTFFPPGYATSAHRTQFTDDDGLPDARLLSYGDPAEPGAIFPTDGDRERRWTFQTHGATDFQFSGIIFARAPAGTANCTEL